MLTRIDRFSTSPNLHTWQDDDAQRAARNVRRQGASSTDDAAPAAPNTADPSASQRRRLAQPPAGGSTFDPDSVDMKAETEVGITPITDPRIAKPQIPQATVAPAQSSQPTPSPAAEPQWLVYRSGRWAIHAWRHSVDGRCQRDHARDANPADRQRYRVSCKSAQGALHRGRKCPD